MTVAAKWDAPEYQRIRSAEYDAGRVKVIFEDGAEVAVDVTCLASPPAREVDWQRMSAATYEIVAPANDGSIEVSWSTVRALTDPDYSAHLVAAAEEQARRVGRRIRDLRRARGLSVEELAARAGINTQSLSQVENGRHGGVLATLRRILAAMDFSLRDLTDVPPGPEDPAQAAADGAGPAPARSDQAL